MYINRLKLINWISGVSKHSCNLSKRWTSTITWKCLNKPAQFVICLCYYFVNTVLFRYIKSIWWRLKKFCILVVHFYMKSVTQNQEETTPKNFLVWKVRAENNTFLFLYLGKQKKVCSFCVAFLFLFYHIIISFLVNVLRAIFLSLRILTSNII